MSQKPKPIFRLILYGGIIAYLIGDLLIFNGILSRTFAGDRVPPQELAASVAGVPITHSQLERTLNEQLWLEGKSAELLPPEDIETARKNALDDLIDHTLLRLQVYSSESPLPVSEEEITERMRRLVGRFESKGALETAMKSQGIATEENLRAHLAARIRQEKLIESRISPNIQVTDEEARRWFEENQASVSLPERVKARHLFLPTLDHPPEEAKQKLDAALADLSSKKKDFASLAKEISEDPATKDSGGELGWMTRDRLPADFGVPVFSLTVNQPTLLRTRLGWHLVEVTDRKPAEPRSFEQAKPEILAALGAIKRRKATEDFRKSLRQANDAKIEIFTRTDPP